MNHVCEGTVRLEEHICPAFTVTDGQIRELNHAARYIGLTPGMSISSMLNAPEEYTGFTGDYLSLSLAVEGTDYYASIEKVNGYDLFLLEHELEQQLWTYSLVSQQLRNPLSEAMLCAERMLQQLPDDTSVVSVNMRRSLNRLHRMVCNMSDAGRYCCETPLHQTMVDIAAVINEVMEKLCDLTQKQGITIQYQPLDEIVDSLGDPEKIERAILNLVSNACKATLTGGTVQVSLSRRENRLLFCIQDSGTGMAEEIRSTAFFRYRRKPSLEDAGQGLGLGMVIVRAAAAAHKGTVLLEHLKEGGTRVTVSFAIRKSVNPTLGTPLPAIDYAGGCDHTLLELSDALPASAYKSE